MDHHTWRGVVLAALMLASCAGPICRAADRADRVLGDFEGGSYAPWQATGEAFGERPATGTLARQQPVSGFIGTGLVNTYRNGDGTTGTLTSPEFVIDRAHVNFLIGGGRHPGAAEIQLLVGDEIVRRATGDDDETLAWSSFDVRAFAGQTARLRIIDEATGRWGHINIDQVTLSDTARATGPAQRTITIDRRYLHLPVKADGKSARMTLEVGGRAVRAMDIVLSSEPDFWVHADVSAWRGEAMTLRIGRGGAALGAIRTADELPDAAGLYREALRPRFHFTAPRGWLNDPNGLVYLDGEWHLFYQHNPFGWHWGNMHWGHAVSLDLFRWTDLGETFHPWSDARGAAFSGSAVVDAGNTAGWQQGDQHVLVAALTDTGAGEAIAYSVDRGRTFTMFEGNPVVRHKGRDPRLLWHEPTKRWVMAVYTEDAGRRWIAFHTSPDLKQWTFASRIEGFYECPDLFEAAVDGDAKRTKWVLYGADGEYVLGAFDGRTFTPEHTGRRRVWHGEFYAAQTFSNAPSGRRVQIGWARGVAFTGMPFNQQMTVPVELTLRSTPEGVRMFAEPVRELATVRGDKRITIDAGALKAGDANPLGAFDAEEAEIDLTFEVGGADRLVVHVHGARVVYDARTSELDCHGVKAALAPIDGRVRLHILVDRGSIECFGNDGRVAISRRHLYDAARRGLGVSVEGGPAVITALKAYAIDSCWRER